MIKDNFIPDGFEAKIRAEMGEKRAEILFSALCGEQETSVRLNSHKPHDGPLYPDMSAVPWCDNGFYLAKRPSFTLNPLLHAGVFYVQDASSMVYETIVKRLFGDSAVKACDLCAAPGGKTTAILNALPPESMMLANEFVPSRANILKENLIKYGYPDIIVTNTNTSRLSSLKGMFDLVAVDAPCSGEGMMRKEETARTQWSEGLIRQCSSLQREILTNAAELLAPGGFLIYSTCTFNSIEDEDNATWIIENLGLEPVDTGMAGKFGIEDAIKGDVPCLRFMPGFTKGEGLFISVFRKAEDCGVFPRKMRESRKGKNDKKKMAEARMEELAKSWIDGDYCILNHDNHLLALSPALSILLSSIPKDVRIMTAGIQIGEIKGKDLIPAHSLAMSTAMAHPFPEVELSKEDALRYLAREAITLPEDTPKGYITVTFGNHPLGFIKNLGNRTNNLYPQEYRIKCRIENFEF